MTDRIYQDIFDKLLDFLPDDWKKVIYVAWYTNGSYSMKFYSKTDNNKYVDCFNMPGISKSAITNLFMDLHRLIAENREELDKNKLWTVFTMQVDSNGYMKAFFEYEDHSRDLLKYEREWEKKYLV